MADIMAMTANPNQTALLIIGDEILSGRTEDANTPYLAKQLGALGLPLAEVRVVPDIEAEIVAAVNALRARYKYVFTTGGIGPTHDDITADSIGAAFGLPVGEDPEALRRLEEYYANSPGKVNAARRRMTRVPQGATLIDNAISAAPGFHIENIFVMAGVPNIVQSMFESIKPLLVGGPPVVTRTVRCHTFEGDLAAGLTAIAMRFADAGVTIGSYPTMKNGGPVVSLVVRGSDAEAVNDAAEDLAAMITELGDTPEVTS